VKKMSLKSMMNFEGIKEFNNFSEILEKLKWEIEKQLLKERVEIYKTLAIYKDLQNKFMNNSLTIWPLKQEEIITWIDTMKLLRRIFNKLYQKGFYGEKFKIIMEYPLIFGNHMRADYLLIYDRLIVLLEFGMFNQDEKRSEERYTKKLQESINYRQLINNLVDDGVKVINYVIIYRPEYDRYLSNYLFENIDYNNQEIETFTIFLLNQINIQDSLNAYSQLVKINNYI
jgi:hypothetical protein